MFKNNIDKYINITHHFYMSNCWTLDKQWFPGPLAILGFLVWITILLNLVKTRVVIAS